MAKTRTGCRSVYQMADTCAARSGARCKDCIYHGNKCDRFMRTHNGIKPGFYDSAKNKIMDGFSRGQTHVNKESLKGDQRNGDQKKQRRSSEES